MRGHFWSVTLQKVLGGEGSPVIGSFGSLAGGSLFAENLILFIETGAFLLNFDIISFRSLLRRSRGCVLCVWTRSKRFRHRINALWMVYTHQGAKKRRFTTRKKTLPRAKRVKSIFRVYPPKLSFFFWGGWSPCVGVCGERGHRWPLLCENLL